MQHFKRIVVKVGSNVLTDQQGWLNVPVLENLVDQLVALRKIQVELILVSSGAVAAGRSLIMHPEKSDPVSTRQLLSSVGQVKLINTYAQLFETRSMHCSQVLVTKGDFRDRSHYLNMKNCFQVLLQNKIIPVVNENDVVSVTELMFTDNDELAGLIAAMMNADALVLLTNVDGVFKGHPEKTNSRLIEQVDAKQDNYANMILTKKSNFGRGGMITKYNMASKVSQSGIHVFIGNGKKENALLNILEGKQKCTRFTAHKSPSNLKKWLAHSEGYAKGKIIVNEGARNALLSNTATSLLPIGISSIEGTFKKGDIIRILDEKHQTLGLGMAQYGYDKAMEKIGLKHQKPLVHYDYLYLS